MRLDIHKDIQFVWENQNLSFLLLNPNTAPFYFLFYFSQSSHFSSWQPPNSCQSFVVSQLSQYPGLFVKFRFKFRLGSGPPGIIYVRNTPTSMLPFLVQQQDFFFMCTIEMKHLNDSLFKYHNVKYAFPCPNSVFYPFSIQNFHFCFHTIMTSKVQAFLQITFDIFHKMGFINYWFSYDLCTSHIMSMT